MRAAATLFLLLSVTLSGCFGGGGDDAPVEDPCEDDQVLCDPEQYFGDHFCEQNDVRPRVYAPDTQGPDNAADPWVVGDFWEYDLSVDGEDLGTTKLAYYALQDEGAHYMVGTPTREEALDHAVHSTNPVIGRVHKTLYSPHESGSHADMFFFPLCQGSTWTDTFFDTEFTFTANRVDVPLPDGSVDDLAFVIRGNAADGSTIEHTYSPRAKWFTAIHLDRADGARVDMDLVDYGDGYAGKAFFLRGQRDEVVDLGAFTGSQQIEVSRQDGGEGPYDSVAVFIDAERSGDGKAEVRVLDPDGESVACVGFAGGGPTGATQCAPGPVTVEVPYAAGEWSVDIRYFPLTGSAELDGEVRVVSVYDRSGSA